MSDVAIYSAENAQVRVQFDGETVWLTQKQIAELFGCDRTVVTKHLGNIFESGELDENSVCAKFAHTTQHGALDGKTQTHKVTCYNLDAIISVGYRVNSKRGVAFRQWATKELRARLVARLAVAGAKEAKAAASAVKSRPVAMLAVPVSRSKSAATCARCLFGRIVRDALSGGRRCECHVSRPTATGGFPLVRPDDFCPLHVSVKARVRSFAGLVPETPQPIPLIVRAAAAADGGAPL